MSETPLEPARFTDVLLRQGEAFSRRDRRGFLIAATVLLGALAAIVYFTVFPNPRAAGASRPGPGPPLDQSAVVVTNVFTKLGWNEHDCRAASRYSVGPKNCPSSVLPAGSYTFVLNTWLIKPHCGTAGERPVYSIRGHRVSPGCIKYTAANGETISYTMTKTPKGWRIVAVSSSRGAPLPSG
jgi:hypothetical protein